jgi:Cation transporter/ATPase, N-terminus
MTETSHLLSHSEGSTLLNLTAPLHEAELADIYTYFESSRWGLTSDEARKSRQVNGLNNIPPPIAAPAWLCCLLPCLLKTKSMEQYHECVPEYAFVMRNKRWVKMDSASIVPGDLIRVESGGKRSKLFSDVMLLMYFQTL